MPTMFHCAGSPATGQKVLLATPTYGPVDASYAYALFRSAQALERADINTEILLRSGDCHVDDARNAIVAHFLDRTDCTDLVFIDADIRWEPRDLIAILRPERDVVGGTYRFKQDDENYPVILRSDQPEIVSDDDGLIEARALPTGFLRIGRRALERLAENAEIFANKADNARIPLIFERTMVDGKRWGGDYTFCRKWTETGGRIWLYPEAALYHTGEAIYSGTFGGFLRRKSGLTLRHVAEQIRRGNLATSLFEEARRFVANWSHGATEDVLMLCTTMAAQANGPILEAGSGLTTILMAAATKHTVFCLENDPEHAQRLILMAKAAGLTNIGLCQTRVHNGWYDLTPFPDLPDRFALGLNDGPLRSLGSRMGFFEHVGTRCDDIICDDTDDPAYAQRIRRWCDENSSVVALMEGRAALVRHHARKEIPDAAD